MNSQEKALSVAAAVLLTVAIFAAALPLVCLTSAVGALALSLYLRHRGAFRNDNMPLLGALLIGGSAITALTGVFVFNVYAAFILIGVVLFPTMLFLMVVIWRERLRAIMRSIDGETHDDKKPQS